MKLMVRPLDREAEKRLIRVLAEVALEVGREDAMGAGGRCEADEVRVGSPHDKKGALDSVRVGGSHDETGALDSVRVSGALDRVAYEDARDLCT